MALPRVSARSRAALTGKGGERPRGGRWKIAASPGEGLNSHSVKADTREPADGVDAGQLAPQQCVAPETQPGCARPPVTTEMRNTNSGPRAPGTPWWPGACPLATALLT